MEEKMLTLQQEATLANVAVAIIQADAELKRIKAESDALHEDLYKTMDEYNVKQWKIETEGITISKVDPVEPETKIAKKFDEALFKMENKDLWELYSKETEEKTRGRKGYVSIRRKAAK